MVIDPVESATEVLGGLNGVERSVLLRCLGLGLKVAEHEAKSPRFRHRLCPPQLRKCVVDFFERGSRVNSVGKRP